MQKSKFLPWLESLRGIACLAVVSEHYIFGGSIYWFSPGNFGVVLFFLISGFIVTKSVIEKEEKPFIFVFLRFFRLYPAYFISLIFAAFVFGADYHSLLLNMTMIQRFLGGHDINGCFWTLQIEVVFYGTIFVLLMFSRLNSRYILILLFLSLVGVVLCGVVRFIFNVKAPSAMPIGLSFILLSSYSYMEDKQALKALFLTISIIVIVFVSSFLSYSKNWGFNENPYRFIFSDLTAIAVFVFCQKRYIFFKLLNFFGRISFSLYLIHEPIRHLADNFLIINIEFSRIVAFVVSALMATILFQLVEKPMNQFARKKSKAFDIHRKH